MSSNMSSKMTSNMSSNMTSNGSNSNYSSNDTPRVHENDGKLKIVAKREGDKTVYRAVLRVNPKNMGALIGVGGCNIRRITSVVRSGCYIRGDGDSFVITAYSDKAVAEAAKMLHKDEKAMVDPSKSSTKPTTTVAVENYLVPHIVGKGGVGIKQLITKVGDGCFIVHKDGKFHITANTEKDLKRAEDLIYLEMEKYSNIRDPNSKKSYPVTPNRPTTRPTPNAPMKPTKTRYDILDDTDGAQERVQERVYGSRQIPRLGSSPDFPSLGNISMTIEKKPRVASGAWCDTQKLGKVVQEVQNAKFRDTPRVIEARRRMVQAKNEEENRGARCQLQFGTQEYEMDLDSPLNRSFESETSVSPDYMPTYSKEDMDEYFSHKYNPTISWADIEDSDDGW